MDKDKIISQNKTTFEEKYIPSKAVRNMIINDNLIFSNQDNVYLIRPVKVNDSEVISCNEVEALPGAITLPAQYVDGPVLEVFQYYFDMENPYNKKRIRFDDNIKNTRVEGFSYDHIHNFYDTENITMIALVLAGISENLSNEKSEKYNFVPEKIKLMMDAYVKTLIYESESEEESKVGLYASYLNELSDCLLDMALGCTVISIMASFNKSEESRFNLIRKENCSMNDNRYFTYIDGELVNVPPIDELCACLKEKFLKQEKRNEYLQEEINKLKSGIFEKEELARMRREYDAMRDDNQRGFPITKEENDGINNWIMDHEKKHKGGHGVSGGKYTYEFTPTGIGTVGLIRCICGKSFCFRDL
ncbi:MAG: hypothetical protein ACI4F4_00635 [Lachnospiraceae bacterium]